MVLDKDIVTVLYVFESVVKVTAISASWPYVSTPKTKNKRGKQSTTRGRKRSQGRSEAALSLGR